MCLVARWEDEDKPYNASKFRWKYMTVLDGDLNSPVQDTEWVVGKWKRAKNENMFDLSHPRDVGFHCFIKRKDAERRVVGASIRVIVKLEVRGFNTSGTWGPHGERCETWKFAKIVAVYTAGHRNITNRFRRLKKSR